MHITIGFIISAIFAGLVIFIGGLFFSEGEMKGILLSIVSGILALAIVLALGFWWTSNTASGQRAYSDQVSEFNGGTYREITITAEDGREIYHYEGVCDIETDHDTDNYILFIDESGLKHIIYWGMMDTIIVNELPPTD